ncbi:MAG TPA: replication protein [Candidatus Saccharimonadales bacterium]|nr:replication protein [Candidatus Saccharimonadales bacterium]
MKQAAASSNESREGFTMIPHSVSEWLLTADLSKREQKVAWLVARLQYGCPKYVGAQFKQADLVSVGIRPSHAKAVIQGLLDKQILTYNWTFKWYELNVGVRRGNEAVYRLRRLVRRNSYRNGNNSTTISVTSLLPKKEAKTYQHGNSEKLPEQELNRDSKRESGEPKDSEIKVKTVKRIKVSGQFVDPATFSPSGEKEGVAFETWQMLEPADHKRLGFYLNLVNTNLSVEDFYRIRSEVLKSEDVNSRGKDFNRKAVECIKQRLAGRSPYHV